MKQKWTMLLAVCIGWSLLFTGCGSNMQKQETVQVVCTIFPEYDWTRRIAAGADGVELTLLIQNGTDLHSYQPSVQDIAKISEADVFCHVGGVSDTWVTDVLKTAKNDSAQTVSMMEAAGADEEVLVEGMQAEEEEHDHEAGETELDEHVWLSLRRAESVCEAIRDALSKADPKNAALYESNCAAYVEELHTMDESYTEMVSQAQRKTILVADRFPFRYLAEDYDLTYYAAFPGCSAETEASFETIAFLSEQVKTLDLPCVLTTESSDQSLAKTVLKNAGSDGEILTLQSLQAVSQEEIDGGATYLSMMEENREVLRTALSAE